MKVESQQKYKESGTHLGSLEIFGFTHILISVLIPIGTRIDRDPRCILINLCYRIFQFTHIDMNNTLLIELASVLLKEFGFECTTYTTPDQGMWYEYRTQRHRVRFFHAKDSGPQKKVWDIVRCEALATAIASDLVVSKSIPKLELCLSRNEDKCLLYKCFDPEFITDKSRRRMPVRAKAEGKTLFLEALREQCCCFGSAFEQ